jgi:hypothetical protein
MLDCDIEKLPASSPFVKSLLSLCLILTRNAEQKQTALARIGTVTPQRAVASAAARGVRVDSRMKLLSKGKDVRVKGLEILRIVGLESRSGGGFMGSFELPAPDIELYTWLKEGFR